MFLMLLVDNMNWFKKISQILEGKEHGLVWTDLGHHTYNKKHNLRYDYKDTETTHDELWIIWQNYTFESKQTSNGDAHALLFDIKLYGKQRPGKEYIARGRYEEKTNTISVLLSDEYRNSSRIDKILNKVENILRKKYNNEAKIYYFE